MAEYSCRESEGRSQDPELQFDIGNNVAQPAGSPPSRHPVPTPLLRPKDEAKPFPTQALGPLGRAASGIAKITAAPSALAAQSVLAAASLACQAHANVETLDGPKPLSLFFVSIAESGERKSACDRLALEGVRCFEQQRQDTYPGAFHAYQNDVSIFESSRRAVLSSRTDASAQREALRDLGEEPKCPAAPELLLTDPTMEGMLKHLEDAQPSLAIFSDEGSQLLGGHGMNSDNRIKTATALSTIWGGGAVNRTRAGTGPSRTFRDCRVAFHLMIQPRLAEQLLADESLRDQGLLSRTLPAWPTSNIGSRSIPDDGHRNHTVEQEALATFHRRILALMESGLPEGPTKPLDLKTLSLSTDAQDLLVRFYNYIEPMQAPGGPLQNIRGFASKAVEQAARVAGIFHTHEGNDVNDVSLGSMSNAIKLLNWYVSEARRLLEVAMVPEPIRKAEALRVWLVSLSSPQFQYQ